MKLSYIKTFVAVVQTGNFSKAAEKLCYTQSAVTIQIKNLENELNTKLFDRVGKNTTLTNKGETFYKYAVKILNNLDEAIEAVSSENNLNGTLSIGVVDSLCSSSFQKILKKYNALYPNVSLSIFTDTPALLFNKLHNNELDFLYLIDEKINNSNFEKVLEIEEDAVFTCCASHPLSTEENVSIELLLQYPFILTEPNASYRKVLDKNLLESNKKINPFMSTKNTELICNMLINNNIISFLPKFLLDDYLNEKHLTILNVPEISIKVSKQMIYHKDKWVSKEMKEFFKLVNS